MNLIHYIEKWYKPRESELGGKYDLVVAVDYATLRREKEFDLLNSESILPKAGLATLEKSIQLVQEGRARGIAWACAPRFGTSLQESNTAKLEVLKWHGLGITKVLAMMECTNSITEAERILDAIRDVKRIILVCDWCHARRLRKIWKHFFDGEIDIVTTDTDWDEDHPSFICRHNLLWLLGNMAHHARLCLQGVDGLRHVVHPVKA